MKPTAFPLLLHAFFHQWLIEQRNTSHHTVVSYRDTWRLFLRHVAAQKGKSVSSLVLSDMTATEVLAFLKNSEEERKVSIGTRNCRLAALRSFFSFLLGREPLAAAQCAEVLRIPSKRAVQRELCYLDPDEVEAILSQPDRSTVEGQRDHALLALLYNTGARIQEALDLCPRAIRLESPSQVRLLGKGRKERTCPLWPETVELLQALLKRQPRTDDQPVFVNRYGQPLGAAGVRFKLKQYVEAAGKKIPTLAGKDISPHSFRHYLPFRTMSPTPAQPPPLWTNARADSDIVFTPLQPLTGERSLAWSTSSTVKSFSPKRRKVHFRRILGLLRNH